MSGYDEVYLKYGEEVDLIQKCLTMYGKKYNFSYEDWGKPNSECWKHVLYLDKNSKEECFETLMNRDTFNEYKVKSFEEWQHVVNKVKDFYLDCQTKREIESTILESGEVIKRENIKGLDSKKNGNTNFIPYLENLKKKGFKARDVENIKESVIEEYRNLSSKTEPGHPRVGLVVGNVQSGKTSNMTGLITLAADNGFNFFIILTGMIDNLRIQTNKRMVKELNNLHKQQLITQPDKWEFIEKPSNKRSFPFDQKLQNLRLGEHEKCRYVTTILKNTRHLENLLKYLNSDLNAKQKLKILIIDDESDLASLDSSSRNSIERSKINKYLGYLAYGKNHKGEDTQTHYHCVNYVEYTATPYGVLLNTPAEEDRSLYPKNFIKVLSTSNLYIGGKEIFGIDYDDGNGQESGLDIIRNISTNDCDILDKIDDDVKNEDINYSYKVPKSLSDSLSWFLCCVAVLRYQGAYKKPASMLIHTSHKTIEHSILNRVVKEWFDRSDKLELCEDIYTEETNRFGKKQFISSLPDYNDGDFSKIQDMPSFNEIRPYLEDIISNNLKEININSEDNRVYSKTGIHLCVDNSKQQDEKRIVYPDSSKEINESVPAFIVIGGNTLSRGLTLKGLVSSYFYRNSKMGDTNIQMARWYGYKQGFELLSRIWLTESTSEKFNEITAIDEELRERLKIAEAKGVKPTEYEQIYIDYPEHCILTSRTKSKGMVAGKISYSGTNNQTTFFKKDDESQKTNLEAMERLITKLGAPLSNEEHRKYYDYKKNTMWINVSQDVVLPFLSEYKYSGIESAFVDNNEKFIDWASENLNKWTVVISQVQPRNSKSTVNMNGVVVRTVERSAVSLNKQGNIFINSIQAPKIKLADIENRFVDEYKREYNNKLTNNAIIKIRNNAKQDNPLLILYLIDKNSQTDKQGRVSLKLNNHLVGLQIFVPGVNTKRGPLTKTVNMDCGGYFESNRKK